MVVRTRWIDKKRKEYKDLSFFYTQSYNAMLRSIGIYYMEDDKIIDYINKKYLILDFRYDSLFLCEEHDMIHKKIFNRNFDIYIDIEKKNKILEFLYQFFNNFEEVFHEMGVRRIEIYKDNNNFIRKNIIKNPIFTDYLKTKKQKDGK